MAEIRFLLGNDSFQKLRENDFYYVDKTLFIKTLLSQGFEVSLITRPRRFGKTLTMSMLEDFFDISRNSRADFEGLAISEDKELCARWQNQWPTILLTFKSIEGMDFESAYGMFRVLISDLCKQFSFLGKSDRVDEDDRIIFQQLKAQTAGDANLRGSLYTLTRMLHAHYGKPVILLIDEYDVPLAKANDNHYYDKMLDVIRSLFNKSLKTNEHLKFAVITGCLKIAKESIFTGTNHMVSDTISSERFEEYIGFTEKEVQKLLKDSGFQDHAEEMRFWYDGYHFGSVDVYCPWDVLNHVAALQKDEASRPKSYWENTSGNRIIRDFIERKDLWEEDQINEDFETLLAGGSIQKNITENLTYDMLHSSADNLWSLLYMTGYLTRTNTPDEKNMEPDQGKVTLTLPNEEIRQLFRTTIRTWFHDQVKATDRTELFDALWSLNEQRCSEILSDMIFETISFHDYREDYYHAFVVGVLSFAGYKVKSNDEEGEGRPDVVLRDERRGRAIVIEVKHSPNIKTMPEKCQEALNQIRERRYAEGLEEDYEEVLGYGICFYKKRCMVTCKRLR